MDAIRDTLNNSKLAIKYMDKYGDIHFVQKRQVICIEWMSPLENRTVVRFLSTQKLKK